MKPSKLFWKIILQIHIYLGLFCSPYLIIFGLSSLDFNHHFLPDTPTSASIAWERSISLTEEEDLKTYADHLLEELELFGWYLPWSSFQDSSKIYIEVSHPAKFYQISIGKDRIAHIKETPESVSHVVKLLHFLGEDIPNAPWWVNAWKYYQALTVYSMIFWFVSGIYLWLRKKNSPKTEKILMYGMAALSSLLILFIWLKN